LTAKGTILGTFQYMAPEQLEGKPADMRSDIWAFGTVLYEMSTGHKAFSGSSQASLIAAILTAQPQTISAQSVVMPALDHIVRKSLAKDPEERWQSAADLKSQLEWIAQGGQQQQEAKAEPLRRRERFVWMAAIGVLLAGVVALGVAHFERTPERARVVRFMFEPPAKTQLFAPSLPVISPDGDRIVFAAIGAEGPPQLWVKSLASLTAQPLPGTEGAIGAFWSPDSRRLGFIAQNKLKKIDLSGGLPQPLI